MRRLAAGLLLPALLLTSCGNAETINHARVEGMIHHWAVTKEHVTNARVQCPTGEPLKAGSSFHCVLRAGSLSTLVTVTVENDRGYLTWSVGS